MSQRAYIRHQLFGDGTAPRRKRGRAPAEDHAALALVVNGLGRTRPANDFGELGWPIDKGISRIDGNTERATWQACTDIADRRAALTEALGLRLDGPR